MTAPKPTRSPIPGATDDTVLTPALRLQGRERAQPVVDWLLAMRLRQHRLTLLFDGFVRQLQGVGVPLARADRKSVVEGKRVAGRVDLGGPRIIKTKTI